MNKAMRKMDATIQDWRLWVKHMGLDIDWDNASVDFVEMIAKRVDKIKSILNQRGADGMYIIGLKEHMELMHSDDDDPQLMLF